MKVIIEKLVYGGMGLSKTIGKSVFVSKTVPGDEVSIDIIKENKSLVFGVIKNIINPSKDRIKPKCPHFNQCGGCNYQNISYQKQLEYKDQIFKETLKRAKITTDVLKIIPSSNHPFHYRNSIRFFFNKNISGEIEMARHHYYKKQLIPIDQCFLVSDTAIIIIKSLVDYINSNILYKSSLWQIKIREGKFTRDMMVEIITISDELPNQEGIVEILKKYKCVKSIYHTIAPSKSLKNLRRRLIWGSPIIFEHIGRYRFQISPGSFFQTNSYGAKTLYNTIKEFSKVSIGDNILDLYCGTGSISIYLSTLPSKILGVDVVPEAIRDANDNVRLNKIKNIKFVCSDVHKFLSFPMHLDRDPDLIGTSVLKFFDVIIVNPPRAGLNKNIIKLISKLKFSRLVYASCNPTTFARDVGEFQKHKIKLIKVQPIDMFPQTHHIECVGLLLKK